MVWMVAQAGGLGPVVEDAGTLGWGPDFWTVFPISLMGMIAFWSTLSLNMPDFTRFGRSQRDQAIGQAARPADDDDPLPARRRPDRLGHRRSCSARRSGIPVALTGKLDNPLARRPHAVRRSLLATLTTNVAANVVSPSYDFSNAWPQRICFRTGGIITGIIGILIMPWNLLADPEASTSSRGSAPTAALTGAIAGVLIADYWWVRRTKLKLADLYRPDGVYRYAGGWNWRSPSSSLLVGVVIAIGGAYSPAGARGPFPADGLIPFLKPFYDYSWVVGLVVAFVLYGVLDAHLGKKAQSRSQTGRACRRGGPGRLTIAGLPGRTARDRPAHREGAPPRGGAPSCCRSTPAAAVPPPRVGGSAQLLPGKTRERAARRPGSGQRSVTIFCWVKKRTPSSPRMARSPMADSLAPPKER